MLANAEGNFTAIFVLLMMICDILYSPRCDSSRFIVFKAVGHDTLGVFTRKQSRHNNRWCPINVDHFSHLMRNCHEFWTPTSMEHTADLSGCTVKTAHDCNRLLRSLSVQEEVTSIYTVCNNIISLTFSRASRAQSCDCHLLVSADVFVSVTIQQQQLELAQWPPCEPTSTLFQGVGELGVYCDGRPT